MPTILPRVKQEIFGETGDVGDFGQIGSESALDPVNTKNLATIQALAQFKNGLAAITATDTPYLEDINSLYLLVTSQLAYILQAGIPEYDATTNYFNLVSFVQVNGVVYQSIFGDATTANVGNAPASSPTKWRNVDPKALLDALNAEIARAEAAEALLAPLASPALTGSPTAPTKSALDNSTKLATTAYTDAAVAVETARAEAAEAAISGASGLTYVQTAVEEAGLTWDPTDAYLLDKAMIATGHIVGEDLYLPAAETQVIFSAARSSANPSFPRYNPIIARDVDKTITSAMAPLLVDKLRAIVASILGTTSFTGTVSGSVVTFANSTANNAMLNVLLQHALTRRWQSSNQSATFAASGGDFTGMMININGAEFAITAISIGSRTITVSGSPTTGSQTCILYPYRILGSTTSIFLPLLSGFVPVGANDFDGVEVAGYLHMDAGQGHWHKVSKDSDHTNLLYTNGGGGASFGTGTTTATASGNWVGGDIITDNTNGTPRTGKTTNPRTVVRNIYIHAGVLLATA